MSKGFLKNLMDKGKALIEKAKPSFMKGPSDIGEICDGLIQVSNQTDSLKLKEANPYFKSKSSPSSLPDVIIAVVGFHHKKGSIIEYTDPEDTQAILQKPPYDDLGKKICSVAIPDAVHTLEVIPIYILIFIERLFFLHLASSRSSMVWSLMFSANRVCTNS